MSQMRMSLLLAQPQGQATALPLYGIWAQLDGRTLTARLPPWQLPRPCKVKEVVCEIYHVTVCKAVRLATALVLCTTGAVQSLSHFAEKLSHGRPQAAAASAQGGDM